MSIKLDSNLIYLDMGKSNLKLDFYKSLYIYLEDIKKYYPGFKAWFDEKVIPDLLSFDRELIIEYRNNLIAGIAIIKKSENKVCTLKVMDNFKNRGIALKLIEKCFLILETKQPFFTISEEKLPEYQNIFKHYNFKLTSVHNSLYRNNKKEYFFNE